MTNYAQIWLVLANSGRIYGQKRPDLWPKEIVGMAMAIVAIPDITSMSDDLFWDKYILEDKNSLLAYLNKKVGALKKMSRWYTLEQMLLLAD